MPVATQDDITAHRTAVADLTDVAAADIGGFVTSLDTDDPLRVARAVREYVPQAATAFSSMSSTVSADWYEELRIAAGVTATYTATDLAAPEAGEIQEAIGYALVPLFGETPSTDGAVTRLQDLIGDVIGSADRQTIESNIGQDPARPRFARHASENACAWCRMLATRGAAYRSEESAGRVVLQRPRNSRPLGEKFHDYCHCTVITVWGGADTYEEAPYVAEWREAYYDAVRALGGASNPKAILARMRQSLGITH